MPVMVRCDREQSAFDGSKAPMSYRLNRPDAADSGRIEVVTRFAVNLLSRPPNRLPRAI